MKNVGIFRDNAGRYSKNAFRFPTRHIPFWNCGTAAFGERNPDISGRALLVIIRPNEPLITQR